MRTVVVLFLVTIASVTGLTTAQESAPPLTPEMAKSALLIVHDHLTEADLTIVDIEIAGEQATVRFAAGNVLSSQHFELVDTEAGRFWQISRQSRNSPSAEQLPESSPAEPEAGPTAEPEQENAPEGPATEEDPFLIRTQPQPPKTTFQRFLQSFFEVARKGNREELAEFYFKPTDFNWSNVNAEDEDPRQVLQNSAAEFLERAEQIAAVLQGASSFEIISYVTSRSSAVERAMLRQIMPRASRYIKEIVVELIVDNQPARITFEGVTYVGSGWRIGTIAEIDLPQPLP